MSRRIDESGEMSLRQGSATAYGSTVLFLSTALFRGHCPRLFMGCPFRATKTMPFDAKTFRVRARVRTRSRAFGVLIWTAMVLLAGGTESQAQSDRTPLAGRKFEVGAQFAFLRETQPPIGTPTGSLLFCLPLRQPRRTVQASVGGWDITSPAISRLRGSSTSSLAKLDIKITSSSGRLLHRLSAKGSTRHCLWPIDGRRRRSLA